MFNVQNNSLSWVLTVNVFIKQYALHDKTQLRVFSAKEGSLAREHHSSTMKRSNKLAVYAILSLLTLCIKYSCARSYQVKFINDIQPVSYSRPFYIPFLI